LAQDAWAKVYRARDIRLQRDGAIKFLPASLMRAQKEKATSRQVAFVVAL
jgi:hypothetical protein